MFLANPFTGIMINANPEGCNQHTGPECEGSIPDPATRLKKLKSLERQAKKDAASARQLVSSAAYSKSLSSKLESLQVDAQEKMRKAVSLSEEVASLESEIKGPQKPDWRIRSPKARF